MIYLLWMILNLALACYFIYLCIQGIKFTRKKFGLFAAVLVTFGMMSFVSGSNSQNSDEKERVKWESPVKDDSLAYRSKGLKKIILFDNLMFSGKLYVSYLEKKGLKEPYFVTCGLNGTTGYYDWKAERIDIEKSENGQNEYKFTVYSTSVFRILLMDFMTTSRQYSGVFQLN